MGRSRTAILCVVALALVAVPAWSQGPARVSEEGGMAGPRQSPIRMGGTNVLLDQPPEQNLLAFSDVDCPLCATGQQSIADNFMITIGDQDIVHVAWFGAFFPNGKPLGTALFDVYVRNDVGGIPDASTSECSVLNASPAASFTGGTVGGVDEVLYELSLDPGDCSLASGGPYWVEIFNTTPNATDQWGWEGGTLDAVNGIPDIAFAQETPGQTWMTVGGFEMAITILGQDKGPTCDGIELGGPAKVTAGEDFDLDVTCAKPNGLVLIAGGRDDQGSVRFVPGCGVTQFDIGPRANNFGSLIADGDGNGTSSQNLNDNFGNNTIYYQAVDAATCELSNVLPVEVNKAGGGGGVLYGSTNVGGGVGPIQNGVGCLGAQLFTVDVVTGAGTFVGCLDDLCADVGSTEIEFDNDSGRAFTQSPNGFFCGNEFDIETGVGIGGPVINNVAFQGQEVVDGTWYAAGVDVGGGGSSLYTFDPFSGVSVVIGATGFGPISGLAWDGSTMYGIAGGGVSEFYTIDLATGAATLVGNTGIVAGSLEFGPDGLLYAGGGQFDAGNLFRIDPATGAATLVGPTGFNEAISGLALVEGDE